MIKKIELQRDKAIVFMGSMNSMPMMYALELKRAGYEVVYFVDAPSKDVLSRPENHFPGITYPYPSWIVESVLPSQILLALFPRLFSFFYKVKIKKATKKTIGCFVLNGFFASLAPYLEKNANCVVLSHGSDLDVWAYKKGAAALANSFKRRSFFRYLPQSMSGAIIKEIINRQYRGMEKSDAVFYFPAGFNAVGDEIIEALSAANVSFVPRYDVSFEPLLGQPREFKAKGPVLNIFSGVRFTFKTFPDNNSGYNKGNDTIIEGIAKYFTINKNIHVHFVEKGEDVDLAKKMCRDLGLEDVVSWHKEMPFKSLLELYRNADICFDQMGENWVGAIGGYALWLGKPLIANCDAAVKARIWPEDNPICASKTADDVFNFLVKLQDDAFREDVSNRSKMFVEKHMGPGAAIEKIFALT